MSSQLNEPERHRLLCGWQAGTLSAQQAARLIEAAREDARLRQEMVELEITERLLRHYGATVGENDLFAAEVIARLREESKNDGTFASAVITRLQPPAATGGRPGKRPWRRAGTWAAAALVLLGISVLLAWRLSPSATVAKVVGLEAVSWGQTQNPLAEGKGLPCGPIELDRGFLSLEFASGASVILEGPARLDLQSRNSARLDYGKVVAEVPEGAKGFILDSPEGRLIDLGTRFGVEVNVQGDTEVHVLQGLVHAKVNGESRTRELRQSQGLRMTTNSVESIEVEPSRFLTALPPHPTGSLGFVHWSFDEGQGTVARDSGVRLGAGKALAKLTSFPPENAGPSWVPGRFGTALEFNGIDNYVATDFPGIAGEQARTVAFWVRVPLDWTPKNGYALVSWGGVQPGEAWQISINPEAKEGPLGRLRVGVAEGPVVGTRDLRDGQWHHAAVVLYGGTEPRDTTHILLYVDGELEPAYRKSIREIQTAVESPNACRVVLGRDLHPQRPPHYKVFRGTLDEVFVADAALSRETIRVLMRENRLPGFSKP